jgi:hypothetical protein
MNKSDIGDIIGFTAAVARATGAMPWQDVQHVVMVLRDASRKIGELNAKYRLVRASFDQERGLDRLHATVLEQVRQIPGARVEISTDPCARAVRLMLPDGSGYAAGGGWWV